MERPAHDDPNLKPPSPPPAKSLEFTSRLRNLLEISRLLTLFESTETTLPAILARFAQTLDLRTAVLALGGGETYVWSAPGVDAAETAAEVARAHADFEYFAERRADCDVFAGVAPGAQSITLPIATHRDRFWGIAQLTGERFDEDDLIYLAAAVNQIAVALKRDSEVRTSLAKSAADLAVSEVGRRSAEAERSEADRARRLQEHLLAVVSHDLKNPLTSILINAELMSASPALAHAERQRAAMVLSAAATMRRLISDLLDWASIDLGKLAIHKSPCRIGALVDEALAMMAPIAAQKGVVLTRRVAAPDAVVPCDRDRTLQVFSNLVGNAIKYSPEGGAVSVSADVRHRSAVFAVADAGPGIARADLPHVFERFWRAEGQSAQGTGLGLAISQGLVHAHGGRIYADSAPGQGSTFSFTLPLA